MNNNNKAIEHNKLLMPNEFDFSNLGFSKTDLLKLANWKMPFGKYTGWALIDLPEAYLFWFQKKGFPDGELGELLKFCLDLKIEGLDGLIKKLRE